MKQRPTQSGTAQYGTVQSSVMCERAYLRIAGVLGVGAGAGVDLDLDVDAPCAFRRDLSR